MIAHLYTLTATVIRKVAGQDYDGNYEQVESEVCGFPCYRQQATAQLIQDMGLTLSKAYAIWCDPNTPVYEGDTLQIGSDLYAVRAIQKNGDGRNAHLELVCAHAGVSA